MSEADDKAVVVASIKAQAQSLKENFSVRAEPCEIFGRYALKLGSEIFSFDTAAALDLALEVALATASAISRNGDL